MFDEAKLYQKRYKKEKTPITEFLYYRRNP